MSAPVNSPWSIKRNTFSGNNYYIRNTGWGGYSELTNWSDIFAYPSGSATETETSGGSPIHHHYTYFGSPVMQRVWDSYNSVWTSSWQLNYSNSQYNFTGANNDTIVTNHMNNSSLNFDNNSAWVDVSSGDNVTVNTGTSAVTLSGRGTVYASAGSDDNFNVHGGIPGISLHAGNGNDKITISTYNNTIRGGVGSDDIVQITNGDNEIHGDDGVDHITILSANHVRVDGGEGSDVITMGSYNTSVYGGTGADEISGHNNNVIHGGGEGSGDDGNDTIKADDSNTIWGDAGADQITVGSSNQVHGGLDTNGTDGNDTIKATDSNTIWGDKGADSIVANDGNIIYGGSSRYDGGSPAYDGADLIQAHDSDTIYGGDGTDSIFAQRHNYIEGNNGVDTVEADDYNTVYGGGAGDSIKVSEYNLVYGGTTYNHDQGDKDDYNDGSDEGFYEADAVDTIEGDIGNTIYAGGGDDQVTINYANIAFGGKGNDTIIAKDKDSIGGGAGNDCIKAGQHAYIDAGPDNDNVKADFNSSIWGADGNDTIDATDTNYIDGGEDSDYITATDDNTIYGGSGSDTISAQDGNAIWGDWGDGKPATIVSGWTDSLNNVNTASYTTFSLTHTDLQNFVRNEGGWAGNDSIVARSRNTIHGGWGDDSISASDFNLAYGDAGKDTLFLNSNNSIWGGAGSDIIQATDFNLIYGDNVRDGADPGAGDDSIVARTDDTIYGGAGKDTIIADDAAKIDAGTGDDSISFGMNSSVVAGTGNDTIVSQAPGSPTAPNGSGGSSIWGGRGDMDSLGRPVYAWGTDVHGNRVPVDPRMAGSTDVHGHNIFTGDDARVTIMDFKFGNDVIHFGKAFEASAVTAFGYGNSTIVPTTDYQIYTAGTDRINVAATISDAADIDMQNEEGKFVIFGNPNGTLKGGFANTLIGGKHNDTIYVGQGDYVHGGLGNDTINLNGYNGWRDHVGLTAEGGIDTISSFQQGWGEGDDVVWYNVPLKKELTDKNGKVTDVVTTNTDAVADLDDANVRVVGDKTVLSQGKAKLILNGVTHGEILIEDGEGVHRTALLGEGYFNDSTRGGQIFIGRKEYSDTVSFEKNNHDLVVDLGMTKRFKDKNAKYYSIEQVIGGSGNNTLVGAKNVRNTLDGGVGTSSIWGGGISADLMVSGTGSATDHYTTFFYGAGDGDDTIEGFRTTDRNDAHFKRDILDIHSGDVTSVRKVGTSIVLRMTGAADRLTIRNAASGLFDQLIEVNVKGRKTAAKVTGANEVVTYDPHAQYYFSNAVMGGTVRNFGDNTRIYLDGRTGDYYKGITNIDVDRGNRLELAGDASNNRIIYRGTGTASLYGGLGNDTMTGSKDGTNRFFFGRSDGNDIITNSTVNDKVMLYDVALEEVVSARETNGTMRIALKSGARLAIQNFDAKSVHDFTLATGDTWVYNHNAGGTGGYWSPKGNYPVQPKA